MQIKKAQNAGACYGVQRALDLALEATLYDGEISTLGELIHNPRVVKELSQSGVKIASSVDEIGSGTVVIRSHGVAPQVFDEITAKNLTVIDATCPHVLRAQKAAAELARRGCFVIIVGEEGHPEVEAIKAHALCAGGEVAVVSNSSEMPSNITAPVGVVVQTTQKQENLEHVLAALRQRGIEPEVRNTICSATQKRQEEAKDLARSSDVMIVIGGRNSSNTSRLAEICQEECKRTYHIESADEITADIIKDASIVGITAGASTPESQIDEVVSRVLSLCDDDSGNTDGLS